MNYAEFTLCSALSTSFGIIISPFVFIRIILHLRNHLTTLMNNSPLYRANPTLHQPQIVAQMIWGII